MKAKSILSKILFVLIIAPPLLVGCASTVNENHQKKLQELDSLYKSGQIDAVQYQVKYNAEVADYNNRRTVAMGMLSRKN